MKKIGIYAGSFNPFHKGHLNIYDKACRIFDEVIIAVGINREKDTTVGIYDRCNDIKTSLSSYYDTEPIVDAYQDLTVDLIKRVQEKDEDASVSLIRGLRDGYDLNYEIKGLRFNQDLMADINVVMIICDREYSHLSSSAIRDLEKIDKRLTYKYLP